MSSTAHDFEPEINDLRKNWIVRCYMMLRTNICCNSQVSKTICVPRRSASALNIDPDVRGAAEPADQTAPSGEVLLGAPGFASAPDPPNLEVDTGSKPGPPSQRPFGTTKDTYTHLMYNSPGASW